MKFLYEEVICGKSDIHFIYENWGIVSRNLVIQKVILTIFIAVDNRMRLSSFLSVLNLPYSPFYFEGETRDPTG